MPACRIIAHYSGIRLGRWLLAFMQSRVLQMLKRLLVAGVFLLAFVVANSAMAHNGRVHHHADATMQAAHDFVQLENQIRSDLASGDVSTGVTARAIQPATYAVSMQQPGLTGDNCPCAQSCCSGPSGCCGSACVAVPTSWLNAPPAASAKIEAARGASIDGVWPPGINRPPISRG